MQKITFQDLPSTTTPINATNLNAIQTNVEDVFNGNTPTGDLIVNSVKTKNLLDKSIIVQGDITGGGTTRLNTRQVLWLNAGTYTFSCLNLASPYEWGIQIQNIGIPPLSAWPTLIYETGWKSTTTQTFTLTTAGWFTLMIRKNDNSTITPSNVASLNFQLEKGSTATSYAPYQNLDNSMENYSTDEKLIGTWIDGKPLYRKVIKTTGGSGNAEYIGRIQGVDTLVDMKVWVNGNSTYFRSGTTSYYGSSSWTSQCYYNKSNGYITMECGNDYLSFKNGATIIITLLYTKDNS